MSETSREFPIRAAPYLHQRKAAAFALERLESGGGAALLMEMGTGKTLTTIAIVGTLWQEARIQRLLVVAPLSILGVWEDEFERFAAFDYNLAVLSGTGTRKADTIRHMNGAALQVLVVNYESAWRLEKELSAWGPDCIACDEGHKIKTHNIAASRALHRLGAKAKYRLLLTGTVITNKPIDVFSQYKFADPSVYGNSFYLFHNRYFDMVGYHRFESCCDHQHSPISNGRGFLYEKIATDRCSIRAILRLWALSAIRMSEGVLAFAHSGRRIQSMRNAA